MAVIPATEPMFIVEPESCYTARMRMPQRLPPIPAATPATPQKPTPPSRHRHNDFLTELVFEVLKSNGDGPVLITTIVNEVLRWGNYTNNIERVELKKKVFKIVGRLIRTCRLDRYKRRFVSVPISDARHQAYLAKAAAPIDLPPPLV